MHYGGLIDMNSNLLQQEDTSPQEHQSFLELSSQILLSSPILEPKDLISQDPNTSPCIQSLDLKPDTQPENPNLLISSTDQSMESIYKRHYETLGRVPRDLNQALFNPRSSDEPENISNTLQDNMDSSNFFNVIPNNREDTEKNSHSEFQSPPCSSNAFSLMMADSEHNPSTSGYSSEQPAKARTQKDLIRTLKELRSFLPPEKKGCSKSSTAASLRYALRCIQQVKANEEYYQLLMANDKQPCRLDVSCYTVHEIESITSDYTRNNTDVFTVAISLVTGRILYISEQASMVLRSGRDLFSQVRFVELVAPQDVSVFYSSTNPYRLPSWSLCNGPDLVSMESLEEKSFYCRISCGRESHKEICYQPFRMMPYLIRMKDGDNMEEQLCCVLFAGRMHSGYEAPRIPADKRIFITTHTPSCLFQDIDERAVPLLGYLPQDLIGTPIILHLHPSDRPLMIAIHKKILQYGGQPFDSSPMRFCARNGEYITIDSSWSSFINPWSRKVSFIIGRHKVRMGPVKEDVFSAAPCTENRSMHPEIQEITEQIYQILLQPVHNSGSSGYGSLGSNGSHENPLSAASSSDSNGNLNEDMKDKHTTSLEQAAEIQVNSGLEFKDQQELEKSPQSGYHSVASTDKQNTVQETTGGFMPSQGKELPVMKPSYSYQQINCLDNVIRYLESYSIPTTSKRKRVPTGNNISSASDDQLQTQRQNLKLQARNPDFVTGLGLDTQSVLQPLHKMINSIPQSTFTPFSKPGPIHSTAFLPMSLSKSTPCTSPPKVSVPESDPEPAPTPGSVSCLSFSSQTVPVCAPDTTLTSLSMDPKPESVVSFTSHCSYSSTIVHVGDKKLQQETELEDYLASMDVPSPAPGTAEKKSFKQLGLTKDVLAAHTQREENDFLTGFMDMKKLSDFHTRCNSYLHERPRAPNTALDRAPNTLWKKSGKTRKPKAKRVCPESWDSSSSGLAQIPRCPLPGLNTTAWSQSETSHASYPPYPILPAYSIPIIPPPQMPVPNETPHEPLSSTCPIPPFPNPMLPPMVAVMLPNYMYATSIPPNIHPLTTAQPIISVQPPSLPNPQPTFPVTNTPFTVLQPTFPVAQPIFPFPPPPFPVLPPLHTPLPSQNLAEPLTNPLPPVSKNMKTLSCSSLPRNPLSPPLFQSRCSSPLQLNLLQLEETQKECTDGIIRNVYRGMPVSNVVASQSCNEFETVHPQPGSSAVAYTSEALSTCSDLLDLLLQEDASCGTESACSDCLTSGSHGPETTDSQTGSSLTSCSSKYFGSVDSSENIQQQVVQSLESKSMNYILQDPMWLVMANTDEKVMMTYRIPQRDLDVVLQQDREKLKSLQKLQPHFSELQKEELGEIHPWIHKGGLPQAIDVKVSDG
ncbi:period circadian protein homolog 2-like [Bombina bombina]|uniref:period circadian protein homolog 2-like n=1 Tax=Bombina bombina TaxID=8345 RepID=UPI00235AE3BF|nr:period circadian protein homolog 2-like [Bombina bombina]